MPRRVATIRSTLIYIMLTMDGRKHSSTLDGYNLTYRPRMFVSYPMMVMLGVLRMLSPEPDSGRSVLKAV